MTQLNESAYSKRTKRNLLEKIQLCLFGVRVSVMFPLMFVHYTLSSAWVVEWPPFGK